MEENIEWSDTFPWCIPRANHLNRRRFVQISPLQSNLEPWPLKGTCKKCRCKRNIAWNDTLQLQPGTKEKNTFTHPINDMAAVAFGKYIAKNR